ncbi:MAG: DUF4440 domain-containing protein [Bacteroidales bacterium]|nr:DUF4440 domain-containing protein [Bacteroidales bacterium]
MKKLNYLLVSFILITTACTTKDKTDTDVDVESIRSVSMKAAKAFNEGDHESFISFFDDNAILLPENAPSVIGIEPIASHYSIYFETYSFKIINSIKEIQVSGDYAFEIGGWAGSLNPKDGSTQIEFNNKAICIYKRDIDGSWKIYRWMYSSNEAPEEPHTPEIP